MGRVCRCEQPSFEDESRSMGWGRPQGIGHRTATASGRMSLEILLMKSEVERITGEQRDGILGGSRPRKLKKT